MSMVSSMPPENIGKLHGGVLILVKLQVEAERERAEKEKEQ